MRVNFKENRGITLIALVVSIIVLLILAGVSISMLTGQNGILKRATEAKNTTEVASEKEGIQMAVTTSQMASDNYTTSIKKDSLQSELNSYFGKEKTTLEDNKDGSYTVTMNNSKRKYTIENDGSIIEGVYDKWNGTDSKEPTEKTSNEIHIYTVAELKWIADKVNNEGNTFEGYTIYLENNLDFGARETSGTWENTENEALKWTAIGKQKDITLKATFEGNNHIIKGVYINEETNFNGIFGNSSSILNLTVKNSYIKGGTCSGTVVGAVRSGTIENCHNINSTVELYDECHGVGGVAGQVKGVIKNCTNIGGRVVGKKDANGNTLTGGVVGTLVAGGAQDCYNTGNVTGEGNSAGGVVGASGTSSTVQDCYNTGNVTGEGNSAGGVVGASGTSSTVQDCYNTGNVTGEGDWVGGVVGTAANIVTKCYNTGTIVSKGIGGTGGIVGTCVTGNSQKISLCYNDGTIQAQDGVGGISGRLGGGGYAGTATKCYNKGRIICTLSEKMKGEIIGNMAYDATVTKCYFMENSENIYGVGAIEGNGNLEEQRKETKKTTTNLKNYEEFLTWIEQQ